MDELYIIIAATITLIVLIFIIWRITTSNKLNRAIIRIDAAVSGIDVALAKRYDVLTEMSKVVKAYTKHEEETILEAINLRKDMTINEKNEANKAMDQSYQKINVVAESYPELKANENFKLLQKAIMDVEEHLQAARRLYNTNVSIYNQLIVTFPTNLVAKSKSMTKKDFFTAEESKKENVQLKL